MCPLQNISIHAPVKGATIYDISLKRLIDISIHAPVKGATQHGLRHLHARIDFNPRTREGCDARAVGLDVFVAVFQSTHP